MEVVQVEVEITLQAIHQVIQVEVQQEQVQELAEVLETKIKILVEIIHQTINLITIQQIIITIIMVEVVFHIQQEHVVER